MGRGLVFCYIVFIVSNGIGYNANVNVWVDRYGIYNTDPKKSASRRNLLSA